MHIIEWWDKKFEYHVSYYCHYVNAYVQLNFKTMQAFYLCENRSSMTTVAIGRDTLTGKLVLPRNHSPIPEAINSAYSKWYELWLAKEILA